LAQVLLGFADYGHIYDDPLAGEVGDLNPAGSTRNALLLNSEVPLAVVYALEALFKITALGGRCYRREYWNQLDFVVSFTGIAQVVAEAALASGNLKGTANFSFLRTFRVLRPLRSLNQFSGMRVRGAPYRPANACPALPELPYLRRLSFRCMLPVLPGLPLYVSTPPLPRLHCIFLSML
jgi:hypothetical protein